MNMDCIRQPQELLFMKCMLCSRKCVDIIVFVLHNNPVDLVPVWNTKLRLRE